jgi:hypothetical protein
MYAFAGGVAVGVVVTRVSMDTPAITTTAAVEAPVPRTSLPDSQATGNAAELAPTPAAAVADAKSVAAPSPQGPLAGATPEQSAVAVDDAAVQRIEVGPVFSEVIARPSQPGFENQLGDAHRALERETRNDGWAYAMEGEIQNSMVNQVSTGEFRADHVECRATLCEVRLSGKGNQAEAIKRWNESLGAQPFGQRLFPNYSSMISNDERADALIIFRRPPASTPPKSR